VPTKYNKYQIATAVAVFFHSIGLAGILFFNRGLFVGLTSLNLLLSFALLIWTQQKTNLPFALFIFLVIAVGFGAEVIGVNTKLLFGDYSYGNVLGIKWLQVPLLIGINWFIIIYCCGVSIHTLLMKAINRVAADSNQPPQALRAISVIVDGATMAVAFDWLMEPVAVKLGFWSWNGEIPLYNYICWFVVSVLMLTFFQFLNFEKQNKFAVNLLLVQAMFFLVLRSFL
jgi:bisanhydrobacterioruberin hydratase